MAEYASYIEYNETNVKKYVPTTAGVYIIRVGLNNGNFQVIYVGQASDLEKRLLEHLRPSEPNQCIRNHVKEYRLQCTWIVLPRQEDRDREELGKYKKYNPECNLQSPPA